MKITTKMQLVSVEKLIPYVNNARTHSKEQINKIRSSLREFGFVNPIIIDKNFGVIAGHGRLTAAKEEGMKEVPCVFVEHLNETQKKAYILADNRLAMDAGWDEELLSLELEELKSLDFDLSTIGFSEEELNKSLNINTNVDGENYGDSEVDINMNYCVVIDCAGEFDAEETFNKLQSEGYKCRISTS